MNILRRLFRWGKTSKDERLEQRVKESSFMNEQTEYRDIKCRDPEPGQPDIIPRNVSRELVVPSFLERYNSLLEKGERAEKGERIYELSFAPSCTGTNDDQHDTYHRRKFRKTGDKILSLFEIYIDIDPIWIQEIRGVLNKRRWRSGSFDIIEDYYLYIATTMLDNSVIDVAKKYNKKPEEVKAYVAKHVLNAASSYFPKRDVPIVVSVYDSLSQEDLPVHIYEQVGKFMKEVYRTHGENSGMLTVEAEKRYREYEKYVARFVDVFKDIDKLKQRNLSPEYWITLAEMVAYGKVEANQNVSEEDILAYREQKHREFHAREKEWIQKSLGDRYSILYSRNIWDAMDVETEHLAHYFDMHTVKPDENVSGEELMRRFDEAETRIERFRTCFTDEHYRHCLSYNLEKEQRVIAAAIVADAVEKDIDGFKILDLFFDLKKHPDQLHKYECEKRFPALTLS